MPGEALDSWLEALAYRLNVRLGDVLGDLGLAAANKNGTRDLAVPADWTIALRQEEAARIAQATGADPQQLHDMTLMRFNGRALRIDQVKRQVSRHALWGRPGGSRFCPECLADSGGRWPLTWRLGWSFACLIHHRLLADRCPDCGRVQRERPFSRNSSAYPRTVRIPAPPGTGDLAIPAGCGQDLTRAETLSLPVGHPALAAQRLVLETIESGNAGFGPYAALPQPAMAALSDLRAVAGRILADLPADDLPRWVPQDLACAHLSADPDGETHRRALARPAFMAPARAASVAVAVTAAFRVLGQPEIQRAEDRHARAGRNHTRGALAGQHNQHRQLGTRHQPRPQGRVSRRLGSVPTPQRPASTPHHLKPAHTPGGRTCSDQPAGAQDTGIPLALLGRQAQPPDGAYPRTLAPALSSSVLLVGNRMDLDEVATDSARPPTAGPSPASCNSSPADPRWEAIAAAVTRVAVYLDDNDVPVDYQRRRRLDYSGLLPPRQWLDLCRRTGVSPGQGRRDKVARCMLFARISGLPVEAAPDFAATGEAYFRAETARFAAIRTPELSAALDETARSFLARHRVRGEPVTWHPPLSLLSGLDLPGPDLSLIDVTRLHELVRERAHPVQYAAEVLGTTVDAVRVVLDEHPAPATPLTAAQARATGQVRHAARQALTEKEFRRRYGDQHQSLYDIAKQAGFSRQTLTRLAAEYGIALREGPRDYKRKGVIDRGWLLEQYVSCGRTLPDLAREKNMSTANMARWAHFHQIPLRPRGGASHDSFLRSTARPPTSLFRSARH